MEFIPTGCKSIDRILKGGLPLGGTSLVYGEAASGRTSFALQCTINCVKTSGNVLFVLTDHLANVERFSQMAGSQKVSIKNIVLFLPKTFDEQSRIVNQMKQYITSRVRLIVFDTVTGLYQAELGPTKDTIHLNRELNRQLAQLAEVAKQYSLSVLLTSHVHSIPEGEPCAVEPVASRILRYWSQIIMKVEKTSALNVRRLILEKFEGKKSRGSCYFRLTREGIQSA